MNETTQDFMGQISYEIDLRSEEFFKKRIPLERKVGSKKREKKRVLSRKEMHSYIRYYFGNTQETTDVHLKLKLHSHNIIVTMNMDELFKYFS